MVKEKIKVESSGYDEYWSPVYKCPYCRAEGMHQFADYCYRCGSELNDVEFIKYDE